MGFIAIRMRKESDASTMKREERKAKRGEGEQSARIEPGARVRTAEGYLGTVERLETRLPGGGAPDTVIVRSDDGQWRYALPLLLARRVERAERGQVLNLELPRSELPYYIAERLGEQGQADRATPAEPGQDEVVVPVAAEDLVVRKEPALWGRVRIHTGVETSEQQVTVPVYHEEAIVERIPAEEYDARAGERPDEIVIPLVEERLVVRRELVVREYLRVRRNRIATSYEVRGTVRREVASISQRDEPDPNLPHAQAAPPGTPSEHPSDLQSPAP